MPATYTKHDGSTGILPDSVLLSNGESNMAGEIWKVIAGIILLAVIVDQFPRLGGWLLLILVIGLALSKRARNIITGNAL